METQRKTVKMVETEQGLIPVQEYLDNQAFIYGFKDYQDMKEQGFYIDDVKTVDYNPNQDLIDVINKYTAEDIKEALESDYSKRDTLYRLLWQDSVEKDVEDRLLEHPDISVCENIAKEIVKYVAHRYVFEGDYECNLSYWENIDNLIDDYSPDRRIAG